MKDHFQPVVEFLSQHGPDLLADLKDVNAELGRVVTDIKHAVESSDLEAMERSAMEGEALTKKKQEEDKWDHVCYRESSVLCKLVLGICIYLKGDCTTSMRYLDTVLILGFPASPSFKTLISEVDEVCKKQQQQQQDLIPNTKLSKSTDTFTTTVPIIEFQEGELSASDFKSKFYNKETPVIIRGLCSSWDAITKWSDTSYFINNSGWRSVPTELGRHRDGDWKEQLMTINEFMSTKMTEGSAIGIGYIAQHDLLSHLQFLKRDVSVPELALAVADEDDIISNCWLGTRNTVTELHRDSYENFFVQTCGSKYVRLYAPNQAKYLYVSSGTSHTAQGNCSSVTCEQEDTSAHPLHAQAAFTDCVLHPGDALYIPSDWFHYLRALTPSISVNFWF
eukprot:TRINITY_DN13712_c0_g1_i1.p1 TRINITY_DN13712_c0_g1~~TRINITY_DN13712_c0_g1_i1.p1  ORF type:complete len:393 (+),score=70.23 TRINITY_DN13712_c0_g1_i1:275-1453(+)